MIEIVEDYSRSGELVCDPFLGGGTTALAARRTGRKFIGIEKDPERAKLSAERIYAESKYSSRQIIKMGQCTLF